MKRFFVCIAILPSPHMQANMCVLSTIVLRGLWVLYGDTVAWPSLPQAPSFQQLEPWVSETHTAQQV